MDDDEKTITRDVFEKKPSTPPEKNKTRQKEEVQLDGPIEEYEKAATTIQAKWKAKKEGKSEKKINEIKGQLLVNLISAKNLLLDGDDDIETFCMAFISSNPENIMKTDNIEGSHNPVWNHKDKVMFGLKKKQFSKTKLIVQVYNLDQGKNLVGEAEISLKEQFENPGQWLNQAYLLRDMEGEKTSDSYVYVQARWEPDDVSLDTSEIPDLIEY